MRTGVIVGLLAGTLLSGLLIGCGCGFLLARFYYDDTVHWERRQQVADTVSVLVAVVDIPAGTVIDDPEKFFTLKEFLADTAPPDFLLDAEQVRGKMVSRGIDAGQPCGAKHFSSLPEPPLPPGMRAVSIRVNDEGRQVQAGARVDVVVTELDPTDDKKRVSRVVLEDIQVLTVHTNHRMQVFATLAVKPDDALKLIAAHDRGPITLLLRKPGE